MVSQRTTTKINSCFSIIYMKFRLMSCVTSTLYFLHCILPCCPVITLATRMRQDQCEYHYYFSSIYASLETLLIKTSAKRLTGYYICSFITLPGSPRIQVNLLAVCRPFPRNPPPPPPQPAPLPFAVATLEKFLEQSS